MVLSELHGAVDAPELIEIGSDSYLGAHVTFRPLKVEGSSGQSYRCFYRRRLLRRAEHVAPARVYDNGRDGREQHHQF